MDLNQHIINFGKPEKWNSLNLYLKYRKKDEFDRAFSKLIEEEVAARGGIEAVHRAYEEAMKQEQTDQLIKKRKLRNYFYLASAVAIVFAALFFWYLNSESRLYRQALHTSSIETCKTYLKKYPTGRDADKIYCKLKVLEMYRGMPVGAPEIDVQDIPVLEDIAENHARKVFQFNASWSELIHKDPRVRKVLREILPKYKQNLEEVNFYGEPARIQLELAFHLRKDLLINGLSED
ncbi:MAG: hypothetical protein JW801_04365 [Bacteroidales bacterium]|nr:hypothetical protein [Bacteroidales bacterium]